MVKKAQERIERDTGGLLYSIKGKVRNFENNCRFAELRCESKKLFFRGSEVYNSLTKALIVEYLAILVACCCERNWVWALYWVGACALTGALLVIKVRA
jgi:hypothetical protein